MVVSAAKLSVGLPRASGVSIATVDVLALDGREQHGDQISARPLTQALQ
jgi:hypothetical protein